MSSVTAELPPGRKRAPRPDEARNYAHDADTEEPEHTERPGADPAEEGEAQRALDDARNEDRACAQAVFAAERSAPLEPDADAVDMSAEIHDEDTERRAREQRADEGDEE